MINANKIKWDYISEVEKEIVFENLNKFNEQRAAGKGKDKDALLNLFNYYNDYVDFKYPKVNSSISCGSCVQNVLRFFKDKLSKWEKGEN